VKSREDLADYFASLNFNKGVEVGVDEGHYSRVLAKANPNLQLKCIDPWRRRGGHMGIAQQTLSDCPNAELMKMHSMDAVKLFPEESLDFIYIDAAHDFDNVMVDIIEWGKRVRVGGIISGHDYSNNFRNGVSINSTEDAVNVYVKHHQLELNVLPVSTGQFRPKSPNENDRPTGLSWWFWK
jgi:predicted O-methyltransferase YrrM